MSPGMWYSPVFVKVYRLFRWTWTHSLKRRCTYISLHGAMRHNKAMFVFFYCKQSKEDFGRAQQKFPTINTMRGEKYEISLHDSRRLWFCCSWAPWWSRTSWSCCSWGLREHPVTKTMRTPICHRFPEDEPNSWLLTSTAHVLTAVYHNEL